MKHLLLSILLFAAFMVASAQSYSENVLFDMAGVSGDSTINFSLNPSEQGGEMYEIEFSTLNCNTLTLKCGYGLTDKYPRYPETFGGLTNPVTLDKAVLSETYKGIESNGFGVDFSAYNGATLWFELTDDAGCTSGQIVLILKN